MATSSLLVLVALLCAVSNAKRYEANWQSLDSRPLPTWFDKAKIGIFLHWGVFSVPSYGPLSAEWFWVYWRSHNKAYVDFTLKNWLRASAKTVFMTKNYKPDFTYEAFAQQFTAEFYEPDRWAELFRKAGAKYVVLTSKHHEGYTMWPSKYSFAWNTDVGPKRDLLGDLAKAVRQHNLTFGVYHSLYEWYHPLYNHDKANHFKTNEFVRNKMQPEMEELVRNYKPAVIWSDGDWEADDVYFNSTHFLAWLYNDSPVKDEVVVNDRWGKGIPCQHGDFYNCHDRWSPNTLQLHKWENAMTIDRKSWGFRRDSSLADYQTPEELIAVLAKTISCGGNILINIGPTRDGRITPLFEERLLQLGEWLKVNGEAIYESTPWTHQNDTVSHNVWYTQRGGHVYAIVTHYPASSHLELGAIDFGAVKSVALLGTQSAVTFTKTEKGHVRVDFPALSPLLPVKYAYVFKFTLQ